MGELVELPPSVIPIIEDYLPKRHELIERPFVTLTYAASLDSRIAAQPGVRTVISHPETKTMTHYIRSFHDAILVGAGTVEADDPKLNCRYPTSNAKEKNTIRPVVVDPQFRWNVTHESAVIKLASAGDALAPWVIVSGLTDPGTYAAKAQIIEAAGGKVLPLGGGAVIPWHDILSELYLSGIKSVMVEGGATVINALLCEPSLVDSLIITIGPTYLGDQGAMVAPPRGVSVKDIRWWQGTSDSVLCGRLGNGT